MKLFDQNNDGHISKTEVVEGLKKLLEEVRALRIEGKWQKK